MSEPFDSADIVVGQIADQKAEVERRRVSLVHPLVLKRILLNHVPKGQTYE